MHYRLNLQNILKSSASEVFAIRKEKFRIVMPEALLSDSVMSLFKDHGIEPYFIILFQHPMLISPYENRILHRDIGVKSVNSFEWRSITAGINFELSEGFNEFRWYDIGENKELYPPDEQMKYQSCRYISAVECHKSLGARGIPTGIRLLDTAVIRKDPVLVRTDVHHITQFAFSELRNGVSIRFHEDSFSNSFENIVERLSDIIIED